MGHLVEDREAAVRAVYRVDDFEAYMRHSFRPDDTDIFPLNATYNPCGGVTYPPGFVQDMFRAWMQHLRFAEWEKERE